MQVTRDGVYSNGSDLCSTCLNDNTECVFKKALNNYHGGGDMPLSLMIMDCPEYRRTENRYNRISWGDFDDRVSREISAQFNPHVTLNPNVTVRFNTGETDSGT